MFHLITNEDKLCTHILFALHTVNYTESLTRAGFAGAQRSYTLHFAYILYALSTRIDLQGDDF